MGFLRNLLKAELELSSGSDEEKASLIANFDNIKTYGDADAYTGSIMAKVATHRQFQTKKTSIKTNYSNDERDLLEFISEQDRNGSGTK